jgi:hypothetical protein
MEVQVGEKEQVYFFVAMLHHYAELSMFFLKGMEALRKGSNQAFVSRV